MARYGGLGSLINMSTSSIMTQSSEPTLVHERKRRHSNPIADCSIMPVAGIDPNYPSLSSISPQSPTMGSTEKTASHNNNSSSSKSYLQMGSSPLKTGMHNKGECSCSGELNPNKVLEEMFESDICMSILEYLGLNRDILTRKEREDTGVTSADLYCSMSCKVCERIESTANMLICDSCDDAFHVSCSNNLKGGKIPEEEWLCNSCLKKKHRMLKGKCKANTDARRNVGLRSLEFMLRDTEPYMTSVRIGVDFQADVPAWSGPVNDASALIGEPLEVEEDPAIDLRTQQKPHLGKWLQCRGGEGVDEPKCGKWRRAPLSEVQTDRWECFCSVFWDPAHADCAVPQELDTEEVMKQLKCAGTMSPKPVAKKRKFSRSKNNGS